MSATRPKALIASGRWALLAAALFLLLTNVLPTVRKIRSVHSRAAQARRRNAELAGRIDRLRRLGNALKTDPYSVERALRDTLHVSNEGERILEKARPAVEPARRRKSDQQ